MVFFYVHGHQLLGVSENGFQSLLPTQSQTEQEDLEPLVALPEHSSVVNVMLHAIYNLSCSHYSPSVETLLAAVEALNKYGVPVPKYVAPSTPLFQAILAVAPLSPIEVYSLAGAYDLYELAIPVSSHLLAYPLSNLTDELAEKMRPAYLKKLFFLHLGRIDALKRLLLPPPYPHVPMEECSFTEQKRLTRAWALASAYLVWDARPGKFADHTLKNPSHTLSSRNEIFPRASSNQLWLPLVSNSAAKLTVPIWGRESSSSKCSGLTSGYAYLPPFLAQILLTFCVSVGRQLYD